MRRSRSRKGAKPLARFRASTYFRLAKDQRLFDSRAATNHDAESEDPRAEPGNAQLARIRARPLAPTAPPSPHPRAAAPPGVQWISYSVDARCSRCPDPPNAEAQSSG